MNGRFVNVFRGVIVLMAASPAHMFAQNPGARRFIDTVDAVVIGEVLSGRQAGKSANCVLRINRVIKGSLIPNDRANVSWGSWLSFDQELTGQYGMWFLNQSAPGQWVLRHLDRSISFLPLPKETSPSSIVIPADVPALPKAVTPGEQMAAELVAALQGYKDSRDIRPLATAFFGLETTPFVTGLYRVLRTSPDPELRFIGLAGMLKLNDLTALTDIANSLDRIPKVYMGGVWLTSAIMARRETTPTVIQTLGRIALSNDLDLQFAAADALAQMHTKDTVPFLIQLLDSPRELTRVSALRGLTRFVENMPISTQYNVWNGRSIIPQGPAPYKSAETDRYRVWGIPPEKAKEPEYIQFWKSWWAKMKGELMKP